MADTKFEYRPDFSAAGASSLYNGSKKSVRHGALSPVQNMFWFVNELLQDRSTLNSTWCFHLKGSLREKDFARAIRIVGQRHEILRTVFLSSVDGPTQHVLATSQLTLESTQIQGPEDVRRCFDTVNRTVYDINKGSTIRALLLIESPTSHYFIFGYHHIIFDGASHVPFLRDLNNIYTGQSSSSGVLQYLDYSNAQHDLYRKGLWRNHLDFWRKELKDLPDPLPLHRSRISARQPLAHYENVRVDCQIDVGLIKKLTSLAKLHKITLFHVYLASFKILLYRFLGVSDLCVGIADSRRVSSNMETGIGPFLNIVPVRMPAKADETFLQAARIARSKALASLSHSEVPLETILRELQIERPATHSPIFQVFLNYIDVGLQEDTQFCDCEMTLDNDLFSPAGLSVDLFVGIAPTPSGETKISLFGHSDLYTRSDLELWSRAFEDTLHEFAASPRHTVGRSINFRPKDIDQALALGSGPPAAEKSASVNVVDLFEQQAFKYLSKIALRDSQRSSLTYQALVDQVQVVARNLLNSGIRPGSRVAVFQNPSVDWTVSMLSIMKIGAIYIPLDSGTPLQRLSLLMMRSKLAAIITHNELESMVGDLNIPAEIGVLDISDLQRRHNDSVESATIESRAPEEVAMVLYTSGSTGTPKGVVLTHYNLIHTFFGHSVAAMPTDVVLQQTTYGFDVSIMQTFLALLNGATLFVASRSARSNLRSMASLICDEGITYTVATPTEYKTWFHESSWEHLRKSRWRMAFSTGEGIPGSMLQLFRNMNIPHLKMFNCYGPTETGYGSTGTYVHFQDEHRYVDHVPAGHALQDESIYILDEYQNLQPVGLPGEIYIAGSGVAQGYLEMDSETKSAFLPNSFASPEYKARGWARMYRTGDRGRLLADGTLQVIGRIMGDSEVKINGVRMDLKEIEQAIINHAKGRLSYAVASVRSTASGHRFLVAHVVFSGPTGEEDHVDYLAGLLNELPLLTQARPAALFKVRDPPMTVGGKLDRRAIAALPLPQPVERRKVDPNSDLSVLEKRVLALWLQVIPKEITDTKTILGDSDFFAVGGTSLLLVQLSALMQERFDQPITLFDLFKSSTLQGMVSLVDRKQTVSDTDESPSFDWSKESQLDHVLDQDDMADESSQPFRKLSSSPPQIAILTGATGFMGRYLLRALLKLKSIRTVICLGVRKESLSKLADFRASGKVRVLVGDLSKPNLGLEHKAINEAFDTADVVIHNGADVSHLKTYSSLKAPNVQSTKDLLRFCAPRRIPFHYISTTGIGLYSDSDAIDETSLKDCTPPPDGSYGYLATKYVSEMLLENLSRRRTHHSIWIHRPSSVLRESAESLGTTTASDITQNMIGYSRKLGAVPRLPHARGYLNFISVENAADMIVRDVSGSCSESHDGGLIYRHVAGDMELPIKDLRPFLEKDGAKVEEVDPGHWITRAAEVGMSSSMVSIFEKMLSGAQDLNLVRILRSSS